MFKIYSIILFVIIVTSCKEEKSMKGTPPILEIRQKTEKSSDSLNELLRVENPAAGQLVASPLEITGEASGYWFFEAEAPTELLDGNLQKISETNITALGQWMTDGWVPFSGIMKFEQPATEKGFLVFHKANVSGLKKDEVRDTIPVIFRLKINPGL